jgi:carboxypeptidase Taq
MEEQIPDAREQIAEGRFENILSWQRTNIHSHGRAKTARELVKDVTGRPLDAKHFTDYLRAKYSEVYKL